MTQTTFVSELYIDHIWTEHSTAERKYKTTGLMQNRFPDQIISALKMGTKTLAASNLLCEVSEKADPLFYTDSAPMGEL